MAVTAPVPTTAVSSAERVRRAAITLFAQRGFHGTGIRDLAREAGMSSASLYHHMDTKETLLAEIMHTSLRRLATAARLATGEVDDPAERLGRLVALHVLTHAQRPEETRVVDNEVAALSPQPRETVVRLRDAYEGHFAAAIADGERMGTFRAGEPALARLAVLEMCNGVARWYSPQGSMDLESLAGHFARISLRVVEAEDPAHTPDVEYCQHIITRVWDS